MKSTLTAVLVDSCLVAAAIVRRNRHSGQRTQPIETVMFSDPFLPVNLLAWLFVSDDYPWSWLQINATRQSQSRPLRPRLSMLFMAPFAGSNE